MRNFKSVDVFKAAKILKKYKVEEIRKEVLAVKDNVDDTEDKTAMGIMGIVELLSNDKTKNAAFEIFALASDKTSKELEDVDGDVLLDELLETNFLRFFTQVGRLMQSL